MEFSKDPTCSLNNAIIQSTSPKRNAEVKNENTDFSSEGSDNHTSPKKQKIVITEEDYLSQFFNEALRFIQKTMKVSTDELQKGIGTVIESFKYQDGNNFSDIDFDKSENLCAYFYRYSLLSAELSRHKILGAVMSCDVLEFGLSRPKINVVSIGGGPGCDIVGLCSALYGNVNCKELNIIVIDKEKRWKSFLNIVEFLLLEGDFGDASSMFQKTNSSISFMCEDVCDADTQSRAYHRVLNNSDVILMKSLLSILTFPLKDFVAKDVVTQMKVGALLLFIDSPYYNFENLGLEKIYSSWIESDPQVSPGKINQPFSVRGSPGKNCGAGISYSSKAQIAVFLKKT